MNLFGHIAPTRQFRRHLADPRRWYARLVLIAFAAAAGLAVVLLNRLGDWALGFFFGVAAVAWWLPMVWMPAITLLILLLTRRFAPGAAGSGIPQVMSAMNPHLEDAERSGFVSLRLSVAKLLLTSLGLLAGLSLGREGPSVQVAAGIMHSARRALGNAAVADRTGLLVAGGAAGIAAAFNAPLAGVMFAIEELSRAPEQRRSGLIISAIVFSGLIAVALQGDANYFGVIHAREIGTSLLLPATVVTLAAGLAGGLFSRLVVMSASQVGRSSVLNWRGRHPYLFTTGCASAIAVIGVVTHGATFGSGYQLTRGLLDGTAPGAGSATFFKFLATWLTTLCMVPGGLFAPALGIGASLGNDVAQWFGIPIATPLIALGMTGFLAATTQAPMTSFIVVMEMVDGHNMVFSLMACALAASIQSKALSPPLYVALSRAQLRVVRSKRALGGSALAVPDPRARASGGKGISGAPANGSKGPG
jgi:H+/Cl- antiporter ClcA